MLALILQFEKIIINLAFYNTNVNYFLMKKITLFIVFVALLLSTNKIQSQAIIEAANWPNTDWELTGVYTVSGLNGNPMVDATFGFDNQVAGAGSQNDNLQAISPVYDLRDATTVVPAEEQVIVHFDYVNYQVGTTLKLRYTVGGNVWIDWQDIPLNTTSNTGYKTCDGLTSFLSDPQLLTSFTEGELQNFRYGIFYDDNATSFQYGGFCVGTPTLESRVTPLCLGVSAISIDETTIQDDQVMVSWTDNNSVTPDAGWEIQYGLANFTLGNGTSITTFSNPLSISGLSASTCYDVYVRALCLDAVNDADDIFSDWVGPLNFCTPIHTAGCGDVFSDLEGLNANYANNADDTRTIFPDNIGPDVVTVLFDAFELENNWDFLSIHDGPTATAGNLIGTYTGTTLPPMTSATLANGGALTFHFTSDGVGVRAGWAARIFCSPPITCFMPENLAVNAASITIHEAEVSWVDTNAAAGEPTSGWTIEYGPIGFEQGTGVGTVVNATTNPFTLTGLSDSTEYCYYVKAACGSVVGEEDSFWEGPVCFTTKCDVFNAPYTENFENNGDTPICWEQGLGNNEPWNFSNDVTEPGHIGNAGNVNGTTTLSGGYFAWVDDDNPNSLNTELISPLIDLTGIADPTLIFYYISNHEFLFSSVNFSIDLYDGTTWHEEIFTHTGNTVDWEQAFVDLSAYAGQTIQLKFIVDEAGFSIFDDFAIDDVFVGELPDCINVNSVNVENVGSNNITLSWNEANSPLSTNWQIVYGAPGIDPNAETPLDVNNNISYVLNGLTDQTDYELYIRSDCGGGSYSLWVGPIQFRTLCPIFTAPYTEDFEDAGFLDSCWTQSAVIAGTEWQLSNNITVPGDLGDNGNVFGTATASGNYFAYVENDVPKVLNNSIATPMIDVSTLATPTLYFYYVSNSNDHVDFSIDIWDGAAWNVGFFTSNHNTAGWEETILDLTTLTITGPIQAKFIVDENNGGTTDDLAIDDVRIDNEPDCWPIFSPSVSNATTTTMDITWVDNDNDVPPTTYYIEYGDVGFALGTGTTQNVNMSAVPYNPYTITGLPVDTDFDFYVVASCPNGESVVGPVQGATLPTCFEVTGFNSFNQTTTTVDVTWNDVNPIVPVGGWDIEVTYPGFAQGTGFVSTVFTNTVTLDDNFVYSNMIPSSTYEVYVRANCAVGDADSSRWTGPFVINTQVGPPINDTCATAITLDVTSECEPVLGNNIQANQTAGLATNCSDPAVSGTNGAFDLFDVWYKIIIPASGTVTITTGFAGVMEDSAMAVYKGACGALVPALSYMPDLTTVNVALKSCSDDDDMNIDPGYPNDSNLFTKIVLQNVTPGDEYYIRVWSVDRTNLGLGNTQGQFIICALGTAVANRNFLEVEEEVLEEEVTLSYYPNPVSNSLRLKSNAAILDIHVYSILGQEVYQKETSTNNISETELDMSSLHAGTYFVKVLLANNETKTIKIIKK